jgi:hypothetical protein
MTLLDSTYPLTASDYPYFQRPDDEMQTETGRRARTVVIVEGLNAGCHISIQRLKFDCCCENLNDSSFLP